MANYKKTEDLANSVQSMTNSLNIGGEFVGSIGGGKAERQERKKIRVGIRSGLKEIRKSGALDASALDASGMPTNPDAYMEAEKTRSKLLNKKADVKDWSTKQRVKKGYRKEVNLLDEPIQAVTKEGESLQHSIDSPYRGQQLNISTIHKDQRSGGGNYGVDPTKESKNYTNVYKKGEYSHSEPFLRPGKPTGSMAPFPTKPPIDRDFGAKPQKEKVDVPGRIDRARSQGPGSIYSRSHFGKRNRRYTTTNRDLLQNTKKAARGKNKELRKEYRGKMSDWRQNKRQDIRGQKADFRQEKRDWIKSIFTG